ncbi:MAG: hypothetical protein AAF449_08720 [Myxococcota bacterium]
MKTLKVTVLFLSMTISSVGQAQSIGGDGTVAPVESPSVLAKRLCAEDGARCPKFPKSLALDRDAFLHALKDLTGCAQHVADENVVLAAGDANTVTQALFHMVLAESKLSLHAKKMAVELLAKLDSKASAAALETIFSHSVEIAGAAVKHRDLPEEKRTKKVGDQAEELRRIVVLAAAKTSDGARLIERAAVDTGRSVALTAQRLRVK